VPRVFSGIQPSGELTLGTYLGALRRFVADQGSTTSVFCIVDLHAITVPQDPAVLRQRTLETGALYLASGIDADQSTLFVQSHVAEHSQLAWLMECTASFGELSRMTQFKEKSDRQQFVSAALFTYPALMAADILLYDTDRVPVGDDQRQHLELTRDVAERFNSRYGPTFTVPTADIPKVGARVMDLQDPTRKMSKSIESPQGTVLMLDPAEVIERKFKRAVTDNDGEVRFDPEGKPGVSNLLSILGAATGDAPEALAERYSQYGPLKADAAAAIVELLRPVQARHAELLADPGALSELLAKGADRARGMASVTLERAQRAVGLR
jgi:tryptophanyl-tRNA synthetase